MKIRFCTTLLLAAFCITFFTGCAAANTLNGAGPVARSPIAAASTRPAETEPKQITKDDALSIALKDAGVTEDQITRLQVEFGHDDGRPEYEVDFHYDGYEYDYKIHAETGTIIFRDKDRDD